jgi:transcriptional regulator with XRE-family HTH domain
MADRLGLSRVHISDLENGKREAGLIVLQILATGFDLTLAKLLSGL